MVESAQSSPSAQADNDATNGSHSATNGSCFAVIVRQMALSKSKPQILVLSDPQARFGTKHPSLNKTSGMG